MIKRALLLASIWFSLSMEGKASQEQISGSDLTYLIIEILNKEGLSSQPVIKRDRIFVGCNNKNVVIKKDTSLGKQLSSHVKRINHGGIHSGIN